MIRVDDIAWSGDLFQRNKIVSNIAWGTLLRESAKGMKRLELYDKQQGCRYMTAPLHIIELSDALDVEPLEQKGKYKHSFRINTTNRKYTFYVKTAEERAVWMCKLNYLIKAIPEPSVIYNFQVQVLPCALAEKLFLSGSYILKIFQTGVALYSAAGTLPTNFSCSLSDLDNLQVTKECTCIVSNRKMELIFFSKSATDIIHIIESRRKQIPSKSPDKELKIATSQQRVKLETFPKLMPGNPTHRPLTNFETIDSWFASKNSSITAKNKPPTNDSSPHVDKCPLSSQNSDEHIPKLPIAPTIPSPKQTLQSLRTHQLPEKVESFDLDESGYMNYDYIQATSLLRLKPLGKPQSIPSPRPSRIELCKKTDWWTDDDDQDYY